MDFLFALMMIWNTLFASADIQAKADAEKLESMLKAEASLFAFKADTVMSADVILLPTTTYPGDAVLIRSQKPDEFTWLGKTYTLLPYEHGFYAYVPILIDTKPGKYTVDGQALQVMAKSFETDRITVTSEQEQMRQETERINADQRKINKARSLSEPLFSSIEPFLIPVQGRLSTPYGYTRYVNGKFSGSHLAVDLAAPTGTPILATNDGKVVLAEPLYLTGNSIYIDHGMNLFSQYAHLSKLMVNAGDTVKRGDIIGLVGTTGFSTGPHLHFAFWIGNTPVNPNLFFNTIPFHWADQ